MDKVQKFYHVTLPFFKTKITNGHKLIPQIHNPSQEWMWLLDSKYKNKIPKLVWFCATLYNGDLPNISPYGKERVRLPIDKLLRQLGGKVNVYRGKDAQVNTNKYIRLMLVKEGDYFDCLEHMEKLNFEDNDLLKFISDSEFEVAKRPNWVEIACPYEVDVTEGEWDTLNK
ncbi:uncharacterized protein LOC110440262 [Mizuhopecten yessoensis]|uniref:uncharacterized protein LOC110440262 n=1 Tax=Mizuhopecten yessoensis TaxID=6573 RepID=UPI000B45B739|nr:uncharacterized protein LOC110440262 [Mizuhopecten yessoensis]